MVNNKIWKLNSHSHQIADTGDYDCIYEITNGAISLYTNDDDDEGMEMVVNALNNCECRFFIEDKSFELSLCEDTVIQLENEIKKLEDVINSIPNKT